MTLVSIPQRLPPEIKSARSWQEFNRWASGQDIFNKAVLDSLRKFQREGVAPAPPSPALATIGGKGNIKGPASSTVGNIATWNNTAGSKLADGGKAAANLVTGPASAVSGNLPSFNGTTGKVLQDSGVASGNLVTASSAFTADNDIPRAVGAARALESSAVTVSDAGRLRAFGKVLDVPMYGGALTSSAGVNAGTDGTTETTLFTVTLPSGVVNTVGVNVRLRLWGVTNGSAVPPTLTLRIKYGSTTLCTLSAAGAAMASGEGWKLDADITTTGSGTVFAQAMIIYPVAMRGDHAENAAAASPTTSGSVTVSVTGQWGAGTAGNVFTVTNGLLEVGGQTS